MIDPTVNTNQVTPVVTTGLPQNAALRLQSQRDYTIDGFWTPQTYMLQSIQKWFFEANLPRAFSALSIDRNPTLDEILQACWPNLHIDHAIHPRHDAQKLLDFADNQYDIVYSHQVLEHIPKPWLAAQESVRVLKPGGIGLHTTCGFNPLHGPPAFKDYYRFLPDGLGELFSDVDVIVKEGWGNREALIYNLAINDGHGDLGGRRFHPMVGQRNDMLYPWVTWIIFKKHDEPHR
jgi:SAM-dependent methyltransferase